MKLTLKHLAMFVAFCMLNLMVSCTKDSTNNVDDAHDNGAGGNTSFPDKKVKKVTIGDLTYDFYWDGNHLNRISCSTPNASVNNMYFYYDGQGRISRTAYQMFENYDIIDAYTYTYDANGRLVKQEIQMPVDREYDPVTQEEYYIYRPTTYTFSYSDGNVSNIHCKRIYWTGSEQTEEIDYRCTWTGGNLTAITEEVDGEYETYAIQYDNKKNPLRFPMGVEVLIPFWPSSEDLDVMHEDYSYIATLFWLAGASVNNSTSMTCYGQSVFTKTYSYDSDGYPISGTLSFEQPVNFTISY